MKRFILLNTFCLFMTTLCTSQSNKEELIHFYNDVLHDSTKYSFQDYVNDSIEISKVDLKFKYLQTIAFTLKNLRACIDTVNSKYMLQEGINNKGHYKKHFNSLFFISEPKSFSLKDERNYVTKFLSQDTISDFFKKNIFPNPFKKQEVESCIATYFKNKSEIKLQSVVNANFILKKDYEARKKYYSEYIIHIPFPIFTNDYKYAYFYWELSWGYRSYGFSGFYNKQNNKWVLVQAYENWSTVD